VTETGRRAHEGAWSALLPPQNEADTRMRWLGVLLIGCGGLADDSRHSSPQIVEADAGPPALARGARDRDPPAKPPENTPRAPRRAPETPAGGVGASCGAELDASRSVTVGGITLGSDPACGASGVCLISVTPGTSVCDPGVPDPSVCVLRTTEDVVPVPPIDTRALEVDHVCSCRCDGPDPSDSYCRCPSGTTCAPLLPSSGVGGRALDQVGSYCVQ
jgi:hypothetical protein